MSDRILGLKLLDKNMRSCNNDINHMQFELGKTYSVKGKIEICKNGFHLTYSPQAWNGKRIFIAETDKVYDAEIDKFVCRNVRLLHELSTKDLEQYEKAEAPLLEQYEKAEAPLWEQYEKARAPLWEQYEKARAPLWEQYKKAEAPLWEQYEKAEAPLLEQYEKARAPLLEQYEKAGAPLWEQYEKGCKKILRKILKEKSE